MALPRREQRLDYVGLTPEDEALLRALRPLLEQRVESVVQAFYDHLRAHPATARLLWDPAVVERLKRLQRDYLLRITEGQFDAEYFADRLRIGQTHERIGLAPRWYLLTSSWYLAYLTPLVHELYRDDPGKAVATVAALQKIFVLDASVVMDAYIESDRYRHLQQLESIVNDSADVIFMVDNDKRIRAWNRAAERIFGWKVDEIRGQHVNAIVPTELLQSGELERIDAELERKGFCHLETRRKAKDGRQVPVELALSVLRDPDGLALGRSVILRDISERQRLQEGKVQSERLAVIGAMAAKLAHEIRNPLSSITLNIELVRDEIEVLTRGTAAGDEARSLLHSINSELRRIQRVTEDYLQFARLPKLHQEPTSINEMLTQGLSFLQSLFKASGVAVRTEFAPDLPPVLADENQLWQAVLNLIRNALEAMPEQGTLTLRTVARDREVQLVVADTGKGMSTAERHQLFRPFFSTKAGGTGLGLPLTQQIVSEHGGRIECESVANHGTTFTIHLPQMTESDDEPTDEHPAG